MSNDNIMYNFCENLINSSYSDNIDIAKQEWRKLTTDENTEGNCICGKTGIKNIVYMCNKYTQSIISIEFSCYMKFGMNQNDQFDNKVYGKYFRDILQRGDYEYVDNKIHIKNHEKKIITFIKRECDEYSKIYFIEAELQLTILLNEVSDLILKNNINYLEPVKQYINETQSELVNNFFRKKKELHKDQSYQKTHEKNYDYSEKPVTVDKKIVQSKSASKTMDRYFAKPVAKQSPNENITVNKTRRIIVKDANGENIIMLT